MFKYKTSVDSIIVKDITRQNFETDTNLNTKNYKIGKRKSPYAVCYACNNPIVIINLYNLDKKPFGRHYPHNVEGLAKFNPTALKFCPYVKPFKSATPNHKKKKIDDTAKLILQTIPLYLDKMMQILRDDIDIFFSKKIAMDIFKDYIHNEGYLFQYSSLSNTPWIMAYMSLGKYKLFGQKIRKNSNLYKELEKHKDITIDIEDSRIIKGDKYVNLEFQFINYRVDRKKEDNSSYENYSIDELVTITVTKNDNLIYENDITINLEKLSEVISSQRDTTEIENNELLLFAKDIISKIKVDN